MKKAIKITGKILLALLMLIILFLLVMFISNKIMMNSERELLKTYPGELVEVDGHNMNVYTKGEGEHTLVFLSGSGTAAPVLDFKSLYSLLEDDYRIAVVEKFGYGAADVVDEERPFDTILEQDRKALEKQGVNAPYILCPHSMSGIEAILWAQKYPDEVEAIVGLDMALPRHYDELDLEGAEKMEKLASVASKLGLTRLFYTDSSLPAALDENDKKLYKAIAAKIAVNCDIIYESNAIPDACAEIDSMPIPDVPTLLFVSDGSEVDVPSWISAQKDYAEKISDAEVIELGCGHYVHNFRQKEIAEKMNGFISSIDTE